MSSIDPFDEPRGEPTPPSMLSTATEAEPSIPSDYTYCPDHDACFLAFMQLLPTGAAWDNIELSYEKSSMIRQFMSGIALSWLHFEDAMCISLDEWICSTSDEDIDAWAKDYGVPDECELYNQNLCAKVSAGGPATSDYLIGLLEASGYEAVGRWLNGQDPQYPGVYSTFHVLIDSTISPAFQLQPSLPFPLGSGHRLGDVNIGNLTCMLERYIPAHCVAVVGIAGEFEPEDLGSKLIYWWAAEDTADGAVTNWIDRQATLSTSTVAGKEPTSSLDAYGRRVVNFNQHIGSYLRTGNVNVPGPSAGPTQYIAMWSQPELLPRPADQLTGELNGLAIDFLHPEPDQVAAVKVAGGVSEYQAHDLLNNVDSFSFATKMIYNSAGILVYTPHNLLTKTEEFDNALWTPKTNCAVTPNATTAPDGTMTADKMTEAASSGSSKEMRQGYVALQGCFSIYAKAAERPAIMLYDTVAAKGDAFNLTTGTIFASPAVTQTGGALMTDVGDGWWRCSIPLAAGSTGIRIYLHRGDNHSYVGEASGTWGVYIWGAQVTHGDSIPDVYLPNYGAAARGGFACDHNPTTLAPRGCLIEAAVTNLFTWSTRFDNAAWSQNRITVIPEALTGPNGRVEADKLVETTENNSHLLGRAAAVTVTAVQYTLSVFAKAGERDWLFLWDSLATNSGAWFNLATGTVGTVQSAVDRTKITALPNGWYRCEVEYTAVGTTAQPYFGVCQADAVTTYTGDGVSGLYLWGAQLELGSTATSPILNYTVTTSLRNNDQIHALTSAIPWNDAEATLYVEYTTRVDGGAVGYVMDAYLNSTNRWAIAHAGGFPIMFNAATTTNVSSVPFGATVVAGVKQKVTFGVKLNDFAATNNGSALATDTVATVATGFTRLSFGHYGALTAGTYLNGWIEKVVLVPRRVPNADMINWRYNASPGDVHAVISRGSASNFRRFGTRYSSGRQAVNVASDAATNLTDTNSGTILSGPIIAAAGFETDMLKARVFGLPTIPFTTAATGTAAQTNSPITIGGNTDAVPGESFEGSVYHLFVCTDLTPSEYLQLEGWAAWDVGRSDVLDGSHPYRNIRP